MATRVTGAELKEVVDTDTDEATLESQFIDTAHTFIDEFLSTAGLSEALLTKIELYLSAHFLVLSEERGGLVVDRLGDAVERYADVYKGGLYMTRFGQVALNLDSSGTLATFGAERKALFRVV